MSKIERRFLRHVCCSGNDCGGDIDVYVVHVQAEGEEGETEEGIGGQENKEEEQEVT